MTQKKLKYCGKLNALWLFHRIINKITRAKTKYFSGQYWTKGFDSLKKLNSYLRNNSSWELMQGKEIDNSVPNAFIRARKLDQQTGYNTPLNQPEITRHNFIIIFAMTMNRNRILDVGGGLQSCFFPICKTNLKLSESLICDVVELPCIVKQAQSLYSNEDRLNYYTNFPDNTKYDIIYFGSSIQYFYNLEQLIKKIKNYEAKYIIISYSGFTKKSKTFFSCALKKENRLLPTAFHSLSLLSNYFKNYNYELLYCEKNKSSGKDISYEWFYKSDVYCNDIIFKKRT